MPYVWTATYAYIKGLIFGLRGREKMEIKVYTSLSGLHSATTQRKLIAVTAKSPLRTAIDDIEIIIKHTEIEEITDTGVITVKCRT